MDVVIVNVYRFYENEYIKTPSLYEFTVECVGGWREDVERIVREKFDRSNHYISCQYVKHNTTSAA